MRRWLVFYGTETTIVSADSEGAAFRAFVKSRYPQGSEFGRLAPPTRDEVHVRLPKESDRDWIMDTDKPEFWALLNEMDRWT